jgi:hypothetical protein
METLRMKAVNESVDILAQERFIAGARNKRFSPPALIRLTA